MHIGTLSLSSKKSISRISLTVFESGLRKSGGSNCFTCSSYCLGYATGSNTSTATTTITRAAQLGSQCSSGCECDSPTAAIYCNNVTPCRLGYHKMSSSTASRSRLCHCIISQYSVTERQASADRPTHFLSQKCRPRLICWCSAFRYAVYWDTKAQSGCCRCILCSDHTPTNGQISNAADHLRAPG